MIALLTLGLTTKTSSIHFIKLNMCIGKYILTHVGNNRFCKLSILTTRYANLTSAHCQLFKPKQTVPNNSSQKFCNLIESILMYLKNEKHFLKMIFFKQASSFRYLRSVNNLNSYYLYKNICV